jgi:hypothetical protein
MEDKKKQHGLRWVVFRLWSVGRLPGYVPTLADLALFEDEDPH